MLFEQEVYRTKTVSKPLELSLLRLSAERKQIPQIVEKPKEDKRKRLKRDLLLALQAGGPRFEPATAHHSLNSNPHNKSSNINRRK